MKVDLNKEEWKFLRRFLERAIMLTEMCIPTGSFNKVTDRVKVDNIIEKLGSYFVVEEKIDDKK